MKDYTHTFIGLSLFICFQSAHAQIENQPLEVQALYKCKALPEPLERLACFDNAVEAFNTANEKGTIVTVSKKQIEKVEKEAFGFNLPSLPSLGSLFGGSKSTSGVNDTNTFDGNINTPPKNNKKVAILSKPEESKIESVEYTIRKTTSFGRNKIRFFFENGQVWDQVDTIEVRQPKERKGVKPQATIRSAALGSFLLRINGKGRAIRVRRVR